MSQDAMEDTVMNDKQPMYIGIDFGTTQSGASRLSSRLPRGGGEITVRDSMAIKVWPGRGPEAVKTPTLIAFGPNDERSWGFEVLPGMRAQFSYIKLLLDLDAPASKFDIPISTRTLDLLRAGMGKLPAGMTAVGLCAAFLTELYNYTMLWLNKHWQMDDVHATFCVTVPATFSDRAKNDLREAAYQAGFTSREGDALRLITEPEAAMIATMNSLAMENGKNPIENNTCAIMMDLGGGTIDYITYHVLRNVSGPPDLDECTGGQGAKSGSVFVDQNFHDWAEATLGAPFLALPPSKVGPNSHFMRQFEDIKQSFGTKKVPKNHIYRILLPMPTCLNSNNYDAAEYEIKFTSQDMENFFAKPVENVIGLLEAQLEATQKAIVRRRPWVDEPQVKSVVLVGGFGSSAYVQDQVALCCKKHGLSLHIMEEPQSAVVRGAALWGLKTVNLKSRVCRRNYGFAFDDDFREGIDPETRIVYQDWHGPKRYLCQGRMSWKIAKGEAIGVGQTIRQDLTMTYIPGENAAIDNIELYCSNADEAPPYNDSPGVELVGYLKADFTALFNRDPDQFERKWRIRKGLTKKLMYLLDYQVEILMDSESGVLKFRVLVEDRDGTTQVVQEKDIEYSLVA
ncbi:hypothetical protein FKW77_000512 [Venturia effusa]|uniref:Uncharacterized protein n=1 Tax=Venturia effusa TaxID=50376 RepID=A0A517L2M6_9PEZI|nr:hypothetical protein FKW77_000512 [Venturia effusa]